MKELVRNRIESTLDLTYVIKECQSCGEQIITKVKREMKMMPSMEKCPNCEGLREFYFERSI